MFRGLLTTVLVLGLASGVAHGADETQGAVSSEAETSSLDVDAAANQSTERIEVTGSHIKRLDVEGASPVETVTRKDLDESGYNAVSDVLRDASVSSFGGTREASGSNAAGNAEVDLRGLGSSNTLVLLDGQRLPSDAVTGAVDLNLIPMAAVERVEILKDGASAIYGSDALGGVVNIITRKDFSGSQVSTTNSVPEAKGGFKTEVGLVNGVHTEKLNMVNVVQYRNNTTIFSRDRPWTDDGISNIGAPGSYQNTGGNWMADPGCPAAQVVHSPQGDFCSFKYSDYSTELPALQQISALSQGTYDLSSRVKLTARVGATQRKVQWSYAAAPGRFTIPGTVADHLGPGGGPLPGAIPGQDLTVQYRLAELGTRDSDITSYSYNVLAGASVQLTDDWQLDLTAAHNGVRSADKGVNGYALTNALTNDIESGAYNPFAPVGQKGSLDNARYVPTEDTTSLLSSAEVKASGSVAELAGGPLGVAVGATVTDQRYEDKFDARSVNGDVFGNAGGSGGGSRGTQALFAETSIPVIPKLELQLAGRYDRYSDFGQTVNPKAAILFHATPSLLLRGSVGTGFKAPLMQDLYAASSNGFPTFIDQVACNAEKAGGGATPSCLPQQYQVTSSGNKGLKEERSVSYNVGAVFEPSRNFNVGADGFLTKTQNVVGIDYDDALLAESKGVNLASYGVIVNRDASGYIENIVAPLQNLASQEVTGVDLSASYQFKALKLSSTHSQLIYFKEEGFPGAGLRNKLGENGRPPWRNTTALSFTPNGRHDVTLAALTIAGQQKMVKEQGNLGTYTSLDLAYAYKSKKLGTFSAGVRNVLGTTPPLDDSNPSAPLNVALYDQIGRQVIVGYSKDF